MNTRADGVTPPGFVVVQAVSSRNRPIGLDGSLAFPKNANSWLVPLSRLSFDNSYAEMNKDTSHYNHSSFRIPPFPHFSDNCGNTCFPQILSFWGRWSGIFVSPGVCDHIHLQEDRGEGIDDYCTWCGSSLLLLCIEEFFHLSKYFAPNNIFPNEPLIDVCEPEEYLQIPN